MKWFCHLFVVYMMRCNRISKFQSINWMLTNFNAIKKSTKIGRRIFSIERKRVTFLRFDFYHGNFGHKNKRGTQSTNTLWWSFAYWPTTSIIRELRTSTRKSKNETWTIGEVNFAFNSFFTVLKYVRMFWFEEFSRSRWDWVCVSLPHTKG